MSRRPTPTHRHIYVIGPPVGLQKIGLATDPRARLATLQTACPFDLLLHLSVAVPFGEAHTIERRAHRLLARSCVRNEWFEATAAEAITAVQSALAPSTTLKPATPAEWRISRPERRPTPAPDIAPLLDAGRQFRPEAGFHKATATSPLPLFDYTPPATDGQAMVDRALEVLVSRMGR